MQCSFLSKFANKKINSFFNKSRPKISKYNYNDFIFLFVVICYYPISNYVYCFTFVGQPNPPWGHLLNYQYFFRQWQIPGGRSMETTHVHARIQFVPSQAGPKHCSAPEAGRLINELQSQKLKLTPGVSSTELKAAKQKSTLGWSSTMTDG